MRIVEAGDCVEIENGEICPGIICMGSREEVHAMLDKLGIYCEFKPEKITVEEDEP